MSMTPEKLKSLFLDLGKPTLRGVRKCPKCGTLNGTRGISCKNKSCDVVFKERDKKKGHSADAVKVVTGSTVQVFSVRLRDRGPDYRGFVQLPLVQDLDGNPAENVDPALLAQAARCYVESCNREVQQQPCSHIKAAINCTEEATPLTLKNSVLNALSVSSETRQSIWMLATETTGPLVQRVTKNIMVVKCKPNAKHPLGFLHFAFFDSHRGRNQVEHKFQCSCKAFRRVSTIKGIAVSREETLKRCVHYYACICAFASDEGLAHEFEYYINLDGELFSTESSSPAPDKLFTVMRTAQEDDDDEDNDGGDVMGTTPIVTGSEVITTELTGHTVATTDQNLEVMIIEEDVGLMLESEAKRRREGDVEGAMLEEHTTEVLEDGTTIVTTTTIADVTTQSGIEAQASSALLTLQEGTAFVHTSQPETFHLPPSTAVHTTAITPKKPLPSLPKPAVSRSTVTPKKFGGPVEESSMTLTFHQWLASITERVNQTMHYQFDGNPEPLVFHAPQKFFDCLQHRISTGNKKRRLPNSTTGFMRKDALPLGTFTKYTWHITNILHVKQIFDTPDMPLQITRSFVENRDGTFDAYEPPSRLTMEGASEGSKYQTPIRPFELKTYLKVGNTARDQKEPTPFIIEWIPDILPQCHIGELRIKFEYGHERNGQIERRTTVVSPTGGEFQQVQAIQV